MSSEVYSQRVNWECEDWSRALCHNLILTYFNYSQDKKVILIRKITIKKLHGFSTRDFSWVLISLCLSRCFSAFFLWPVFFLGILTLPHVYTGSRNKLPWMCDKMCKPNPYSKRIFLYKNTINFKLPKMLEYSTLHKY